MNRTLRRSALLATLTLWCALGATAAAATAPPQPAAGEQRVVLAGGCFWGMQAVFQSLRGVSDVTAGYSGGAADTAHYEMVSTGTTGHAESVSIDYDPRVISFKQLLDVYFFVAHDPTELDRQGPDTGNQYRSSIFFTTPGQQRTALADIAALDARRAFSSKIVTTVVPLVAFYPAEAYHQNFVRLHPDQPYVAYEDLPKLAALRKDYPALVAPESTAVSLTR